MQKVTGFFGCFLLAILLTSFNRPVKAKVNWLSIAEMQAAYKKEPKPILVDVYTGWCGWCKVMDQQTYSQEKVANYINEKYYAVKFDAESKDTVEWNGRKFGYNPQSKMNDMAVYFLNGQMSFPTTVFLTSPQAAPAPLAGYLKPKEIESPLKFFGEGAYKTKNFPDFIKAFSGSW